MLVSAAPRLVEWLASTPLVRSDRLHPPEAPCFLDLFQFPMCFKAHTVGATHQTVLERGTAEHSDRPNRGQASAVKSKSPELGPSGPRWTRCDNRRNFLYNRSNCLTIRLYTGIRETTQISIQVPELSAGKKISVERL